jgi:molecular chaperone DnaK
MAKVIGIDLGTTNSLVAVVEGGKPFVIPNLLGKRMTPSVVRILENGNYIVGENAARSLISDPKNTIAGIKRFMGRRYNEVIDLITTVPYDVVLGRNNLAVVNVHGIEYSPQVISAMILQYLKASAEKYLGEVVTQAVITVPAYFSDFQRQVTKEAGIFAGLEVLRIVNEPTAASMAYGLNKTETSECIAVFDLGGGTFDITILEVGDGVFEVMSVGGDGFLGGDDFDNRIINWILEEIKLVYRTDLSNNIYAQQRIAEVSNKAKCEISEIYEAQILIPYLIKTDGDFLNLEIVLTRPKFNDICEELFEKLVFPCEQAIKSAKIDRTKIDKVILVGGATRMNKVEDIIKKVFNVEPNRSVNPDEVVGLGAAIQAGVLAGERGESGIILLLDVTTHSFGIENMNGTIDKIIPRDTTIPTKKSEIFSTSIDGQTSVEIHILEGERELAIENRSLGRFILDGIPPAPKGVPQIEVILDIDANGVLSVLAKDKGTNKSQNMTIELSTKSSNNDVDFLSKTFAMNAVSIEKMQIK